MYIEEIIYPGTWLKFSDHDLAFELEHMLRYIEDRVSEATIALKMFEDSISSLVYPRTELEQDEIIRQQVEEELRTEVGDIYFQNIIRYQFEIERRILRKKVDLDIMPKSYRHKVPFIHAHSFVYAVDSFGKFLDELCDYNVTPKTVSDARDEFNKRLPMVRKIRNSALHIEDRCRRYASSQDKKNGKRFNVQGFMALSFLEGNLLCYTINDGTCQKISISRDTLKVLFDTINKVLAAFPWEGPPHFSPS